MGDFRSMRPTRVKSAILHTCMHGATNGRHVEGFRIFLFKAPTFFFTSAIKEFMKKEVDAARCEKLSYQ